MAGTCCNPFLGFGMVGYCVGFTFFIVGLVTRNWMVPIQSGDNALLGLFQWCTIDGHCITLGSKLLVAVQSLIIIAAVLAFLSMYVTLAVLIRSGKVPHKTHIKSAVASFVMAFLSGILGFIGSIIYAVNFHSIDYLGIDMYPKTELSYSFGLSLTASIVMLFFACFVLTGAIKMVKASRAPQGQVISTVQAPMAACYTGQNVMASHSYQPTQIGTQPYQPTQIGTQPYQTTQMGAQPYQPNQMYVPAQYQPNQQYILGQFQPNQQ